MTTTYTSPIGSLAADVRPGFRNCWMVRLYTGEKTYRLLDFASLAEAKKVAREYAEHIA